MSNISMVEAKLPPGFRFHPRDDELVCDYLMKKMTLSESLLMIEVDLNKCEPWDIPETACVGGKEWYFYSLRDRKYATGLRTNRATATGYWKATGKDRAVLRKGSLVGMRKTLVFYQGRAPKGRKSDWVMHEFRIEGPLGPPKISSIKEDWVLCRVFYKNREVAAAKPSNMGSDLFYNGAIARGGGTSVSHLPSLMDSFNIAFDQAQPPHHHHPHHQNLLGSLYEQVPCFSSVYLSQNQPNHSPIFLAHHHSQPHAEPDTSKTANNNIVMHAAASTINGAMADLGSSCNDMGSSSYSCDQKILKDVLSQLTNKMESHCSNPEFKHSPSLGEGSSESFLSEVGVPNMWNPF